jgi:hypothetical protein
VTTICAETKICPIEALREFSARVFLHFGCPKGDAEQAADVGSPRTDKMVAASIQWADMEPRE